ncbi:MAG: hypothetical protein AVDCRST_MAG10-823, partial [uncultured Acidimicrobiales bacterium]
AADDRHHGHYVDDCPAPGERDLCQPVPGRRRGDGGWSEPRPGTQRGRGSRRLGPGGQRKRHHRPAGSGCGVHEDDGPRLVRTGRRLSTSGCRLRPAEMRGLPAAQHRPGL